ncbi:hypothetical protein [Saccharopolyspora hattusasensis]|uniref:hypothetical protein n=1 Tax=Saccharopolyspora hattusasensis TaxID=1128679 RepID=UPI003D97DE40
MPDLDARIRAELDNPQIENADDLEYLKDDYAAALRAVLDLHTGIKVHGQDVCEECSTGAGYFQHPCNTVTRIARALGVETDG